MRKFLVVATGFAASLATPALGTAIITSGSGTAVSVTPAVTAFRTALGTLNANVAGSFGSGRREINWDGVPGSLSAPNALPANFFNSNSPRGAVFSTPGGGFMVSSNAADGPIEFGNIDATYSATFATFSAQRLFTAIGSNILDVNFFLPGSTTAAGVAGFGAIFSDVDLANTTSIQFFDTANNLLGTWFAPAAPGSESLSFLGVRFDAGELVGRVRITSGNTALGAGVTDQNGNGRDLVVMDDFIFGEPVASAVPEPGSWALMLTGFMLMGSVLRKKRHGKNAVQH